MRFDIFACIVGRSHRHYCTMFNRASRHDDIELAYPFWVLRKADRTILVDTGFSAEIAGARAVFDYRSPTELLARLKIDPAELTTIVVSHLHYDHFSQPERYPNATFFIQGDDVDYFTGRGRSHPATATADTAALDQIATLRAAGRIRTLDGDFALDDSIKLVRVGGHTPGHQITVLAPKGVPPIVLACDASHFYANLQTRTPTSLIHDYDQYQRGFATIETFAEDGEWFPGHDPQMLEKFEEIDERIYRVPWN